MSGARAARRRAEPAGIGSARARDPLALEVRLLGALLGQVIVEQAGEAIFDLVERLRLAAIAFRNDDDPAVRGRLEAELDALELADAEAVITAFSLYFQLVNLAEARARVRTLRRRERAGTRWRARRLGRRGGRASSVAPGAPRPTSTGSSSDCRSRRSSPPTRPRPAGGRRSWLCVAAPRCWSGSTTRA